MQSGLSGCGPEFARMEWIRRENTWSDFWHTDYKEKTKSLSTKQGKTNGKRHWTARSSGVFHFHRKCDNWGKAVCCARIPDTMCKVRSKVLHTSKERLTEEWMKHETVDGKYRYYLGNLCTQRHILSTKDGNTKEQSEIRSARSFNV